MRVPVLTAVADADREATLVRAFEAPGSAVQVVRRCVDLADLLATANAGTARAVVLSADLRRLDRDALSRLAVCGLAVVGIAADEPQERRLRQLGVLHVVAGDAAPDAVARVVTGAVADIGIVAPATIADATTTVGEPGATGAAGARGAGTARSGGAAGAGASASGAAAGATGAARTAGADGAAGVGSAAGADVAEGRVVAVWGPTGAPGRTTLAVNLAAELAGLGVPTTLVDADVYGGAVAQCLGLLDEAPGFAAAARLANNGVLDRLGLAELARGVTGELRVLTGMTRADRWPELRPAAVEAVLDLARGLAAWTVVDCAFCLDDDETRRNAATLAVLANADIVLAVGSADPLSLQRLVRGLGDLGGFAGEPRVVVNRVRNGVMPGDARGEITAALERYAGVTPVAFLPLDQAATDKAMMRGQTLAEAAPESPLRQAIRAFAGKLAGQPAQRRRGLLRRR